MAVLACLGIGLGQGSQVDGGLLCFASRRNVGDVWS